MFEIFLLFKVGCILSIVSCCHRIISYDALPITERSQNHQSLYEAEVHSGKSMMIYPEARRFLMSLASQPGQESSVLSISSSGCLHLCLLCLRSCVPRPVAHLLPLGALGGTCALCCNKDTKGPGEIRLAVQLNSIVFFCPQRSCPSGIWHISPRQAC